MQPAGQLITTSSCCSTRYCSAATDILGDLYTEAFGECYAILEARSLYHSRRVVVGFPSTACSKRWRWDLLDLSRIALAGKLHAAHESVHNHMYSDQACEYTLCPCDLFQRKRIASSRNGGIRLSWPPPDITPRHR